METVHEETKKVVHQGHNVRRLRQAMKVKQDALALELNLTQQAISYYEQKSEIEDDMIQKIAQILKVSPELIKSMEEDPATSIVIENNTVETNHGTAFSYMEEQTVNHPIDQMINLFERFLSEEKRKNDLLEQMVKEKK